MKNYFLSLSANVLNSFWDFTKNLLLSIYFLFEIFFTFLLMSFMFFENLILSSNSQKKNTVSNFVLGFAHYSAIQVNSFYVNMLEELKFDKLSKITSDILILVSIYSFFSIYAFTGSAAVGFSNEGLWLSILTLAVIYFFFYLRTLDNLGQNAISQEIENLKKVMQKNSELASEVASLESQTLSSLEEVVEILENWFFEISDVVEYLDSELRADQNQIQINFIVNIVFREHFQDLLKLNIAREDLNKVISLKDQKEEIISEVFESI